MNFTKVRCYGCGPGGTEPHDHLVEQHQASAFARTKRKRGFGGMSPERRKEIASMGGKAAQAKGTAHQFTRDEARIAGQKGGQLVAQNRAHMAEIGKLGGRSTHQKEGNPE